MPGLAILGQSIFWATLAWPKKSVVPCRHGLKNIELAQIMISTHAWPNLDYRSSWRIRTQETKNRHNHYDRRKTSLACISSICASKCQHLVRNAIGTALQTNIKKSLCRWYIKKHWLLCRRDGIEKCTFIRFISRLNGY